jgi:hypothetical protein
MGEEVEAIIRGALLFLNHRLCERPIDGVEATTLPRCIGRLLYGMRKDGRYLLVRRLLALVGFHWTGFGHHKELDRFA